MAQRNYDLNKAAELQYGKLPQLKKQLEEEETRVHGEENSILRERVTDEEIAKNRVQMDRYSGCKADRERA